MNSVFTENITTKENYTLWALEGSLNRLNFNEADEKGEKYLKNSTALVVDLSKLEYISSAGIRVLMRLLTNAKTQNKKFMVVCPQGMIRDILEGARIDMLIPFVSSVDDVQL